jgi:hypothetical protein
VIAIYDCGFDSRLLPGSWVARPDKIADIQQAHVAMMYIDAAEKQGGA